MPKEPTVIEDATISALLSNPELVKAVPELRAAAEKAAATKGCGSCNKKQKGKAINYANAKRAIGNLPTAKMEVIRKALGADQIRVYYRADSGKQVKLTYKPRT